MKISAPALFQLNLEDTRGKRACIFKSIGIFFPTATLRTCTHSPSRVRSVTELGDHRSLTKSSQAAFATLSAAPHLNIIFFSLPFRTSTSGALAERSRSCRRLWKAMSWAFSSAGTALACNPGNVTGKRDVLMILPIERRRGTLSV